MQGLIKGKKLLQKLKTPWSIYKGKSKFPLVSQVYILFFKRGCPSYHSSRTTAKVNGCPHESTKHSSKRIEKQTTIYLAHPSK